MNPIHEQWSTCLYQNVLSSRATCRVPAVSFAGDDTITGVRHMTTEVVHASCASFVPVARPAMILACFVAVPTTYFTRSHGANLLCVNINRDLVHAFLYAYHAVPRYQISIHRIAMSDGISLLGRETPGYILDEVRKRLKQNRDTSSLTAKLAAEYGYRHANYIVKHGIRLQTANNDRNRQPVNAAQCCKS